MNPSQNLAPDCYRAPHAADRDRAPDRDRALNETDNISTRLRKAKEFIQNNPKEQRITAARIYNLPESTLRSSISRDQHIHGGQNKILQEHHKHAIHQFI